MHNCLYPLQALFGFGSDGNRTDIGWHRPHTLLLMPTHQKNPMAMGVQCFLGQYALIHVDVCAHPPVPLGPPQLSLSDFQFPLL